MRTFITAFFILSSVSLSWSKTINLDVYLAKYYQAKEYQQCYKLCKVIHKNHYSEYELAPFNIKYKNGWAYTSDSSKYYEYHCLQKLDPGTLYYFYAVKHEEVKNYFTKEEIDAPFIHWVDSLYHSPINDGRSAVANNSVTKMYASTEDIPEIKNNYLLNLKLCELYRFLKTYDPDSWKSIFYADNSTLVSIVKNRTTKEKDLLSLPVSDFSLFPCGLYSNIHTAEIEIKLCDYYASLFKQQRFLLKEQISDFLYANTNFTPEEKMFVTFHFISCFINYNKEGKFTNPFDINLVILYRHTICNGYALLMEYFLRQQKIECYKVHLEPTCGLHANNVVVINDKVYYVDACWNVYYREIKTLPAQVVKKEYREPNVCDYTRIKDFSYIGEVIHYDTQQALTRFKTLSRQ